MDFTTVIAAPDAPLRDLLARVEAGLIEAGFRHDFSVVRAGYDPERGVFDELFPIEEVRAEAGFQQLPRELSLWQGCSCEFWRESLMLSLLIARVGPGQQVNAWVEVPLRMFTRLLETQDEGRVYGALGVIASALNAKGGYGHPELGFEPLALDRAQTAFIDLPEHPGEPALLGLLPASSGNALEMRARYPNFHARLSTRGYWVLTQDLAAILLP